MACSLAGPGVRIDAQEAKGLPRRQRPGVAKGEPGLRISTAAVCRSIDGYEDYELLPDAALTSEEKLHIYYRPSGYTIVSRGDDYLAHFLQDGQIRRKGEKAVLRRKRNILDYEAKSQQPPERIFLRNSVPLKGLPPGEYEYDILLRDANGGGAVVTRSLAFKIIPPSRPEGGPPR
jgi:hypothetical protein